MLGDRDARYTRRRRTECSPPGKVRDGLDKAVRLYDRIGLLVNNSALHCTLVKPQRLDTHQLEPVEDAWCPEHISFE